MPKKATISTVTIFEQSGLLVMGFYVGNDGAGIQEADFGTISSAEEHYYAWRDIWPEENRSYTPPLGVGREQEKLIQGMLVHDTLLRILRTCTVFMDLDTGNPRHH